MKRFSFLLLTLLMLTAFSPSKTAISWLNLEQGLDYATFKAPLKSIVGDEMIDVLRINPEYFNINMFSTKEGNLLQTADNWAKDKQQIAIFNAGMYQGDHKTNVGYMRDFDFVNNSNLNSDNAILAFNAKADSLPKVQIIDRKCQDWSSLMTGYNTMTQSIRMVDCNQKNRWAKQDRKWSMVVTAMDKSGNLLFIFTRSPYTVHDFINMLLNSELNIYNMMYLEGGPEASFYLNHPKMKVAKMGSYETNFWEDDTNDEFWQIPNVIGIERK